MVMLAAQFVLAASMAMFLPLQQNSDGLASHAEAAQQAEQRGDFSAAIHEYEFLTRQLPRNAELLSNLGVALYFDHQWERSLTVLHKAITLNPKLQPPHLFSGLAAYQLGKPDAAAPELETAARLSPSDVIAHTWVGYAYLDQSRYDAAAKQFEAATQLAPDNVDAWYALGQAYLQIGKQDTLALLKAEPDGGRTWQLAAEQYELQGNRQKALEDYTQANKRRPDIVEVRSALSELGGTPAADQGTQLPSAKEDALYTNAHVVEQKSRDAFERVRAIAPDSYRAHQIMASALDTQQQYDKAIAEYRLVLKEKPDLPGIHGAIGTCLLRSGHSAEALEEFQAELHLQPHSASANTNVGQALVLMGRDEDAAKAFHAALTMDRPPPDVYRLLGKLELHRNNFRAAADNLTHYVALRQDDATAYYLLSRAYRGLDEKQQMNQALARYASLSQDAKDRRLAQRQLEQFDNTRPLDEDAADQTKPM